MNNLNRTASRTNSPALDTKGSRLHGWRLWFAGAGLLLLCVVAAALSLRIGARSVSWDDVFQALAGQQSTLEQAAVTKRIPRTILGLLAGAALSVSGALMQGVTRNPVADPGILGVNMGASLAVVTGIAIFGMEHLESYLWAAILGAALTGIVVYLLGAIGPGGPTPLKLTLAGAATGMALSSLVSALILPRADISAAVRSWQIGNIGSTTWEALRIASPFFLTGMVLSLLVAKKLNTLALGDELATGLGENVFVARAIAALAGVILAGATTALTGPIAFVGLMIPHACRLIVGPDYRLILPLSALVGASFLTLIDTLGRIIAPPAEVATSVLTAIIGAPVFIILIKRMRIKEL